MAAVSSSKKIESDVEGLIDLFLSPHYDPDAYLEVLHGSDNEEQFEFESAGDSGNFEYEAEVNGKDETETSDLHPTHEKLHMGRQLARFGDEFYKSKTPVFKESREQITSHIQDVFRPLEKLGISIPEKAQEEAWAKFKGILDKSIGGTGAEDGVHILGALLLTFNGLKTFQSGARQMARAFAVRYVNELEIPAQLEASGGLECLD